MHPNLASGLKMLMWLNRQIPTVTLKPNGKIPRSVEVIIGVKGGGGASGTWVSGSCAHKPFDVRWVKTARMNTKSGGSAGTYSYCTCDTQKQSRVFLLWSVYRTWGRKISIKFYSVAVNPACSRSNGSQLWPCATSWQVKQCTGKSLTLYVPSKACFTISNM